MRRQGSATDTAGRKWLSSGFLSFYINPSSLSHSLLHSSLPSVCPKLWYWKPALNWNWSLICRFYLLSVINSSYWFLKKQVWTCRHFLFLSKPLHVCSINSQVCFTYIYYFLDMGFSFLQFSTFSSFECGHSIIFNTWYWKVSIL